jgi:hypothetical protein
MASKNVLLKNTILLLIICVLFCNSLYAQYNDGFYSHKNFENLRKNFTGNENDEQLIQFVDDIIQNPYYGSLYTVQADYFWPYIYQKGQEYFLRVAKIFHEKYNENEYRIITDEGDWISPIEVAINYYDLDSIEALAKIDPEIVNLKNTTFSKKGIDWDQSVPLSIAVSKNDIDLVNKLVSMGANLNWEYLTIWSLYKNLFALSDSKEMDALLILYGVKTYRLLANDDWIENCNDNDVNIRMDPSLDAKIVGKLMVNDQVHILGYTYKQYYIPGHLMSYRWLKIKHDKTIGWVFGEYIKHLYK